MMNVWPAHHPYVYNAHLIINIVKFVRVGMGQILEYACLASVKTV